MKGARYHRGAPILAENHKLPGRVHGQVAPQNDQEDMNEHVEGLIREPLVDPFSDQDPQRYNRHEDS